MKTGIFSILSAMILFAVSSCVGPKEVEVHKLEGFALGTVWSVTIKGDMPDDMRDQIESLLSQADRSMSVFNPESTISKLNDNRSDRVDEHIARCIEVAREVSELSGGKYDITVLPLVEAYGFAAKEPDFDVNVDSLLQFIGYDKIEVRNGRLIKSDPRIRLDLNSVAKGYIVDMVASLIDKNGIRDYLVNIGGEIFARGTNRNGNKWGVGVETPIEGNMTPGRSIERRVDVSDKAVATSGNYRNFRTDAAGRKFTHIIDPTSGNNTESNLLSASVVAENCARADALGTMYITLGLDGSTDIIEEHPELAVLLIYADQDGNLLTYYSAAMKPYLGNN